MKKIFVCLTIMVFILVACGESKPSKGEVKSALSELVAEQSNADTTEAKEQIKTYVDCIVEEIYDDFTPETLRDALKARNAEQFEEDASDEEVTVLDNARETCASELSAASE